VISKKKSKHKPYISFSLEQERKQEQEILKAICTWTESTNLIL
jgi:hypothetical protein